MGLKRETNRKKAEPTFFLDKNKLVTKLNYRKKPQILSNSKEIIFSSLSSYALYHSRTKNRDQIRNLDYNSEIIPSSRFLDRSSEKIDANIDVTQKTTRQKLKERES